MERIYNKCEGCTAYKYCDTVVPSTKLCKVKPIKNK